MSTEQQIQTFRDNYSLLRAEIGKVIVGQNEIVEGTLIAVLAGGHVLLEGVPGLGKTLLVRTLSESLDLSFSRIQFTPDLMPADILGTNLVMETPAGRREFQFQRGPIFAHIILADEINRATPKTQSAMLEAMQEKQVTAGGELIIAGGTGNGYRLGELMGATNPNGWAGVLKVKNPAGATAGYILLYTNP